MNSQMIHRGLGGSRAQETFVPVELGCITFLGVDVFTNLEVL